MVENNKLKTSEARRKANKKWDSANPEIIKYSKAKSATKNFILKKVKDEDLNEIENWLTERKNNGLR